MMREKISMDKTYKTRDGRDVRILCTDINDSLYPVVGIIKHGNGKESSQKWTTDGRFIYDSNTENAVDLIEVKPRIEGWINIYPRNNMTKEEADAIAGSDRIACIKVSLEEGEGLEGDESC